MFQFCWMWIFRWMKLSWRSCFMWKKLGLLNWFWQFPNEGLPSFNLKRIYYTYVWSCSFCEKTTSFCVILISWYLYCKTLQVLTYIFCLDLLHLVPFFLFLHRSSSLPLCTVFHFLLSNIDEVLLIKPFANVFVFGDFNAYHKDWLAYSGGTDRSGGIWNDVTQMVNFLTLIPECDSDSRAL